MTPNEELEKMINKNTIKRNSRELFDFIEKEEIEKLNYEYSKKNDLYVLKETITKLSVQNQQLLEQVNDLKISIDVTRDSVDTLERVIRHLCFEIVNYVDIEKLRKDLETMKFASKNVEDLLRYISGLRPYKNEVENDS